MDENEFTGPDGTRYQAVEDAGGTFDTSCRLCALFGRSSGCPSRRVWPGEPRCSRPDRKDHRNIYWVVCHEPEVEPNPL